MKPTEKEGKRGRETSAEPREREKEREDVRKYKSGETLLNSLLNKWNLYLLFRPFVFLDSFMNIYSFPFLCFMSHFINEANLLCTNITVSPT